MFSPGWSHKRGVSAESPPGHPTQWRARRPAAQPSWNRNRSRRRVLRRLATVGSLVGYQDVERAANLRICPQSCNDGLVTPDGAGVVTTAEYAVRSESGTLLD